MKKPKGFIALTSVIIIGAVALAVGIGVSLRSIDEANMSLAEEMSFRSQVAAEGCGEYALQKLKDSLNYSGNEIIIIGDQECEILEVEGNGNSDRIVKVESTISGYTKKIKIEIGKINPSIEIISWENVADFS